MLASRLLPSAFERAMAQWLAAKQRRPAPLGNQQKQKQQPNTVFDRDGDDLVQNSEHGQWTV
eukprot:scaffold248019_cov9-Tisochrysis_lutea.AAC.1